MNARLLTSPAYDGLLERLAERQPNNGFQSADQLAPLLTPVDMATVLDHEPTVLADACGGEALVTHVAGYLRSDEGDINRAAFIGACLQGALAAKIRDYLLPEVQEERYRRTDISAEERTFEVGQHVRYVPYHAHGDASHPDCENGVVSSIRTHSPVDGSPMDPPIIFVRFRGETGQGCKPDQLR